MQTESKGLGAEARRRSGNRDEDRGLVQKKSESSGYAFRVLVRLVSARVLSWLLCPCVRVWFCFSGPARMITVMFHLRLTLVLPFGDSCTRRISKEKIGAPTVPSRKEQDRRTRACSLARLPCERPEGVVS